MSEQNTMGLLGNSVFKLNDRYQNVSVRTCVRFLFLTFENDRVEIDPLVSEIEVNAFIEVVVGGNNTGPILEHLEVPLADIIEVGVFDFPADFSLENYASYVHSKITQFDDNEEHNELMELDYSDLEFDINNTIAANIPGLVELATRLTNTAISNYTNNVKAFGAAMLPVLQ